MYTGMLKPKEYCSFICYTSLKVSIISLAVCPRESICLTQQIT